MNARRKINTDIIKRIIIIKTKLPSRRNQDRQDRNRKKKMNILIHISTNKIKKQSELIYAGVKLVSDRISVLKNTNRNSKSEWEIRLIKNLRQQTKMIRQWKNTGTHRIEKRNATQVKQTNRENKSEVTDERRKTKRYRHKIKRYRQKKTFQNHERKFYQQAKGECTKTCQQPDNKETKQFWNKIWERREHNRKAERVNNVEKQLELEEGPKGEILLDSLRETYKNVPNCKMPGHDGVYGYWFTKFISIHD